LHARLLGSLLNLLVRKNKMADTASSSETMGESAAMGGKRSAWMAHLMKVKRAHKGKSLKQVMKMASKTFKKSRKGGAALSPATVGGRRRTMKGGSALSPAAVGGKRRKTAKGGRKH
jgi:hypothetical protein